MQTMHIFSGIGGGLLSDLILGHKPIVAIEWDKYACQVLQERAAGGWFPDLHVHEGDVRLFDPSEYTGRVDIIHAGFPCQDISNAGSQAGIGGDTRSGLYREVLRIASIVRPRIIFLENVAAITSKSKDYLEVIAKDIFEIGYNAQWLCLSAADVGANHKRERWWCMATMGNTEHARLDASKVIKSIGEGSDDYKAGQDQASESKGSGFKYADVADTNSKWEPQPQGMFSDQRGRTCDCGYDVVNTKCTGCEKQYPSAITSGSGQHTRSNDPQWSDRPAQSGVGGVADGIPIGVHSGWWQSEPDIGRVAAGIKDRSGRIKGLGNAQVPLQAAVAFSILAGVSLK
jgi:DNA (cytosine-5)-methyltransferase 1